MSGRQTSPMVAARAWSVSHLDAGHDANGNPRRLLVGRWHADERIIDEGFEGVGERRFRRDFGDLARWASEERTPITAATYRAMLARAVY